ncbi:MAG: phosphatase PAP2 family protein [Bacteroidetes bacterium]|nr:phosphatase PAP2 family protein [Fibrella sp.]
MQSLTGWTQTTPSPYELRTGCEVILLGAGVASVGASLALDDNLTPLDAATIPTLNRRAINGFDRPATYQFSKTAGRLSTLVLAGTAVAAGAVGISPNARQDWKTVGTMYVETILLANGVERSVEKLVTRNRPFVYYPNAPLSEKLTTDARRSFFSSHATNAFASAVFAGEVFRHYYPNSRLKPVVWIGTLGLATATSVLRYEAGKHYPTDLMAGAAFGSLVGWGIPKLHEVKNRHSALKQLDIQPWSTGQATGLYARWTLK